MFAFSLDVENVTLDFSICKGAVNAAGGEKDAGEGSAGSDSELVDFGLRKFGDFIGDGG